MKIIAHRGNLYGPDPATENTVEQLKKAIEAGFDVEVDVWSVGGLYLGHDAPNLKEHLSLLWVYEEDRRIWFHCKNQYAALELWPLNAFMHERDPLVFTSNGDMWVLPGTPMQNHNDTNRRVVACLPELAPDWDISQATHICTDYPFEYREKYPLTV